MTDGEKKSVLIALLVGSALALVILVALALWHVQHESLGWAWFWGILAGIPAAVMYEILRRWNRVQ